MNEKCPNCEKFLEGNDFLKCSNCNIDIPKYIGTSLKKIKDDKELLLNNEKRISDDIAQKTWDKLVRVIWIWIVALSTLLSLVVGISLIGIYRKVVKDTNEQINTLISKQFEEPRIKQILTEVAKTKAEDILVNRIKPEIDNFKAEINRELGSVKELSGGLKTKYAADYDTFNLEVVKLKDRNRLTELADMAISNMDVAAFKKLEKTANDSTKPELIPAAVSEMNRVKAFFATMTSARGASITYKGPLGSELKDSDISTISLISDLRKNNNRVARIKIAELLANRKERNVPEALIEIMNNDTDLEVRKEALKSFDLITGHVSGDVFGFKVANDWWIENKAEIDKKLN